MIEGEKVRLRAVERPDLIKYVEWANSRAVWENMGGGPNFISHVNDEQWLGDALKDRRRCQLSIETLDRTLIGDCSLEHIDWISRHAELTISIGDPEYRGKGYGTDAVRLLLDLAFNQYNLHRVYLYVLDTNYRGQVCYAKCGFRQEGVMRQSVYLDGVYHDWILMSVLQHEYVRDQLERTRCGAELAGAGERVGGSGRRIVDR